MGAEPMSSGTSNLPSTRPLAPLKILIYGATGLSGRKVVAKLRRHPDFSLILAGRNLPKVMSMSQTFGLPGRVFRLDDPQLVPEFLKGADFLLNCAAPFAKSVPILLEAAAKVGVHYLDLSSDVTALRFVFQNHERWQRAGILAIPAIGFSSLATEALVAYGKRRFPAADSVKIFLRSQQKRLSKGQAQALMSLMKQGALERQGGKLVSLGFGEGAELSPFSGQEETCLPFPMADLVTVWSACKIANIKTLLCMPVWHVGVLRKLRNLRFLLWLPFRALLVRMIPFMTGRTLAPRGANAKDSAMDLCIELSCDRSGRYVIRAQTKEPHDFTQHIAQLCLEKLASGAFPYLSGAVAASVLSEDSWLAMPELWTAVEEGFVSDLPGESP